MVQHTLPCGPCPVQATHIPAKVCEAAWLFPTLRRQGGAWRGQALALGLFPSPYLLLEGSLCGSSWWLKMEQHPAIFGEKDFGVYHGVTRRLPGHQSEGPTIPAHVLRARAQAPPHPAAVVGAGLVSSSTPTGKLDPGKQLRGGYHFPNLNVHIYFRYYFWSGNSCSRCCRGSHLKLDRGVNVFLLLEVPDQSTQNTQKEGLEVSNMCANPYDSSENHIFSPLVCGYPDPSYAHDVSCAQKSFFMMTFQICIKDQSDPPCIQGILQLASFPICSRMMGHLSLLAS